MNTNRGKKLDPEKMKARPPRGPNKAGGRSPSSVPSREPPVLPRAKGYDTDVDLGSLDRENYLVWALEQLRLGIEDAPNHSVAYVQAINAAHKLHSELSAIREAANAPKDPANMTAEEWQAKLEMDAQACTDDDLEVYVRVWLEREGMVVVHEQDGGIRLVRRSA